MTLPKAATPEEIEMIKEEYRHRIEANPALENALKAKMEMETAEAMAGRLQPLTPCGGELENRLKAENAEILRMNTVFPSPSASNDNLIAFNGNDISLKGNDIRQAAPVPFTIAVPSMAQADNQSPDGIKWICTCGSINTSPFCPECGNKKSLEKWLCPCGAINTTRFCSECGKKGRD